MKIMFAYEEEMEVPDNATDEEIEALLKKGDKEFIWCRQSESNSLFYPEY